jgi:RNA polymerase sigma factor (sigma-70 family)
MPPQQDPFACLLARARNGDREAFARLLKEYEPEIRRVARVSLSPVLRSVLDSMDLVQSAHRSLLSGLLKDEYDLSSPEKLVALAATIVRRKAARHGRRPRASRPIHQSALEIPELLMGQCPPGDDPLQSAQARDWMNHISQRLGDEEKRLLELRMANYSTADAAAELGIDAATFRVRLHRLRRRLRELDVPHDWM